MSNSKSFKTYAVSLNFDKPSSEKILSAVRDFSKITNQYLTEHSVPPHLTLGMFHALDEDSAALSSIFDDFARNAELSLLETNSSGLLEFGGTDNFKEKVIFLSVKKDSESFALLKKLNENLHEKFLLKFNAGANQNYIQKNFFPHIALAVKLKPSEFENAKNPCTKKILIPDSAKIASVSLALTHPYKEIARIDFHSVCKPYR